MEIKVNVTGKRAGKVLWFLAVALVYIGVFLFINMLLSSFDKSSAGMFMMGIQMIADDYWYLWLIPVIVFGIGMFNSAKYNNSFFLSLFKWFFTAMAVYIVVLSIAVLTALN